MGSLTTTTEWRDRGERFAAWMVLVLPLLLLAFPFARALGRLIVDADFSSLSFVFWKIIARALAVTTLQAAASAVLAGALGVLGGVLLAFTPGRVSRVASDFVRSLGALVFVFPGVLTAMLVMGWARALPWVPGSGLVAIVLAHVLVNVAFLASSVNERLRSSLATGGLDRLEAAATMGARGWSLGQAAIGPLLRSELAVWLPLVFLWSFSAFSTLVILGGSPATANLEVILFYSLQNADDSARVLVLMVLQLGVAWLAWRLSERVDSHAEMAQGDDASVVALVNSRFALGSWVACLVSTLFLLPFVPVLVAPLRLLLAWREGSEAPVGFGNATFITLALATVTALCSWGFFELVLRAGSRRRRILAYGLGLSTTFLAAAWVGAGVEGALHSPLLQVLAAGLAVSVVQWSLVAFWVERRLSAIPEEAWQAAGTLGAPLGEIHSRIVRPQLKDVRFKVILAAFLGAAGELSISTLFLRDVETVAVLSRRLASRYDFGGALWVTSLLVLVTAVAFLLQRRARR